MGNAFSEIKLVFIKAEGSRSADFLAVKDHGGSVTGTADGIANKCFPRVAKTNLIVATIV